MAQEEQGYGTGSIVFSFFLGGLIGAGIALLTAPKTGRETREKIKELTSEAKDKAGTYIEQVKSKAASTMEKGKGLLEETKSIITTAVEAGKEAYEKEKEKHVAS
jgi:gas vesicle protein